MINSYCLLDKYDRRNAIVSSGGFVRIWVILYSYPAVNNNNTFLLTVMFASLTCISNSCLVRLYTSPIACAASTVRIVDRVLIVAYAAASCGAPYGMILAVHMVIVQICVLRCGGS